MGLTLRDLAFDGQDKCNTLIRMNSVDRDNADKSLLKTYGARASAEWVLERVSFLHAKNGFTCGDDSWSCASDMTLTDVKFYQCETGFKTVSQQNLNYMFTRVNLSKCDVGLHFKKGGSVVANLITGHGCGTAIKIDSGGINNGTFVFNGIRVEARTFKGKRTSILDVKGTVNVTITGLLSTCMGLVTPPAGSVERGKKPNVDKPLITLGERAMVSIRGSMLSGPIADLSGRSWLSFTDCRFRFLADPRKDIKAAKDSGFLIRDSWLVEDKLVDGKCVTIRNTFISELRKDIGLPSAG